MLSESLGSEKRRQPHKDFISSCYAISLVDEIPDEPFQSSNEQVAAGEPKKPLTFACKTRNYEDLLRPNVVTLNARKVLTAMLESLRTKRVFLAGQASTATDIRRTDC